MEIGKIMGDVTVVEFSVWGTNRRVVVTARRLRKPQVAKRFSSYTRTNPHTDDTKKDSELGQPLQLQKKLKFRHRKPPHSKPFRTTSSSVRTRALSIRRRNICTPGWSNRTSVDVSISLFLNLTIRPVSTFTFP